MESKKKPQWAKRIVYYAIGILVMTFGVAMAARADIGVAPGSLLSFAVSQLTPLTIGQCTSIFHIFFMLLQLLITRRPSIRLLLQFPMAFVVGFIMDIFYGWLDFGDQGYVFRVLFLLGGLIVFSFGIRIIVGADVLLSPADGVAISFGQLFGWPMAKGKLAFDIIITVVTALLTLIAARKPFMAVGVGTAICALGTGPFIGVFTKLFPFFDVGKTKKA